MSDRDALLSEALPSGPVRRHPLSRRSTPHDRAPRRSSDVGGDRWEHDRYEGAERRREGFAQRDGLRSGYRVIVSGLDAHTPIRTVDQLCRSFGYVVSCRQGRNPDTQEPVGVVEVVFAHEGDADRATKELTGSTLDGKALIVERRGRAFISADTQPRRHSSGPRDRDRTPRDRTPRDRAPRERRERPTEASLDSALDAYMSQE